MTNYVLDVSKWRCGDTSVKALGEGTTHMLNHEGYSCCLGQFALQQGVTSEELLDRAAPENVARALCNKVYDAAFVSECASRNHRVEGTELSNDLIRINDSHNTSYQEKIVSIREKLEEHGHSLTVINDPLSNNNPAS